ncbi:MAG: hypothetical protein KDD46_06905, partial [Bdellovibrionales bacterium]|nr:hypothetical protein [Bdellovibrionales bacterium]
MRRKPTTFQSWISQILIYVFVLQWTEAALARPAFLDNFSIFGSKKETSKEISDNELGKILQAYVVQEDARCKSTFAINSTAVHSEIDKTHAQLGLIELFLDDFEKRIQEQLHPYTGSVSYNEADTSRLSCIPFTLNDILVHIYSQIQKQASCFSMDKPDFAQCESVYHWKNVLHRIVFTTLFKRDNLYALMLIAQDQYQTLYPNLAKDLKSDFEMWFNLYQFFQGHHFLHQADLTDVIQIFMNNAKNTNKYDQTSEYFIQGLQTLQHAYNQQTDQNTKTRSLLSSPSEGNSDNEQADQANLAGISLYAIKDAAFATWSQYVRLYGKNYFQAWQQETPDSMLTEEQRKQKEEGTYFNYGKYKTTTQAAIDAICKATPGNWQSLELRRSWRSNCYYGSIVYEGQKIKFSEYLSKLFQEYWQMHYANNIQTLQMPSEEIPQEISALYFTPENYPYNRRRRPQYYETDIANFNARVSQYNQTCQQVHNQVEVERKRYDQMQGYTTSYGIPVKPQFIYTVDAIERSLTPEAKQQFTQLHSSFLFSDELSRLIMMDETFRKNHGYSSYKENLKRCAKEDISREHEDIIGLAKISSPTEIINTEIRIITAQVESIYNSLKNHQKALNAPDDVDFEETLEYYLQYAPNAAFSFIASHPSVEFAKSLAKYIDSYASEEKWHVIEKTVLLALGTIVIGGALYVLTGGAGEALLPSIVSFLALGLGLYEVFRIPMRIFRLEEHNRQLMFGLVSQSQPWVENMVHQFDENQNMITREWISFTINIALLPVFAVGTLRNIENLQLQNLIRRANIMTETGDYSSVLYEKLIQQIRSHPAYRPITPKTVSNHTPGGYAKNANAEKLPSVQIRPRNNPASDEPIWNPQSGPKPGRSPYPDPRHGKEIRTPSRPSTDSPPSTVRPTSPTTPSKNAVETVAPQANTTLHFEGYTLEEMLSQNGITLAPVQVEVLPPLMPSTITTLRPISPLFQGLDHITSHSDALSTGDLTSSEQKEILKKLHEDFEEHRRKTQTAWDIIQSGGSTNDFYIQSIIKQLAESGNRQAKEWLSKHFKGPHSSHDTFYQIGFPYLQSDIVNRQQFTFIKDTKEKVKAWLANRHEPIPAKYFWDFYQFASVDSPYQDQLIIEMGLEKTSNGFARIPFERSETFAARMILSLDLLQFKDSPLPLIQFIQAQQLNIDNRRYQYWLDHNQLDQIRAYFGIQDVSDDDMQNTTSSYTGTSSNKRLIQNAIVYVLEENSFVENAQTIALCLKAKEENGHFMQTNLPRMKTKEDFLNHFDESEETLSTITQSRFFELLGQTEEERWTVFLKADFQAQTYLEQFLYTLANTNKSSQTNQTNKSDVTSTIPVPESTLPKDDGSERYQRVTTFIDNVGSSADAAHNYITKLSDKKTAAYKQVEAEIIKHGLKDKLKEFKVVLLHTHLKNHMVMGTTPFKYLTERQQNIVMNNLADFTYYLNYFLGIPLPQANALTRILADAGVLGSSEEVENEITQPTQRQATQKRISPHGFPPDVQSIMNVAYTEAYILYALRHIDHPAFQYTHFENNFLDYANNPLMDVTSEDAQNIAKEFAKKVTNFELRFLPIYFHYASLSENEFEASIQIRKHLGLKRTRDGHLNFFYPERAFSTRLTLYLQRTFPNVDWTEIRKLLRLIQNIQDIHLIRENWSESDSFLVWLRSYYNNNGLHPEAIHTQITTNSYYAYYRDIGQLTNWYPRIEELRRVSGEFGFDLSTIFSDFVSFSTDEPIEIRHSSVVEKPTDLTGDEIFELQEYLDNAGELNTRIVNLMNKAITYIREEGLHLEKDSFWSLLYTRCREQLYYASFSFLRDDLPYNLVPFRQEASTDEQNQFILKTFSQLYPDTKDQNWGEYFHRFLQNNYARPLWSLEGASSNHLILHVFPRNTLLQNTEINYMQANIYFLKDPTEFRFYFYIEPIGIDKPGKYYPIEFFPYLETLFTPYGLVGGYYPNQSTDLQIISFTQEDRNSPIIPYYSDLREDITPYTPPTRAHQHSIEKDFIQHYVRPEFPNESDFVQISDLALYMSDHSNLTLEDAFIIILSTHLRGIKATEGTNADFAKMRAIKNLIDIGILHGLPKTGFPERITNLSQQGVLGKDHRTTPSTSEVPPNKPTQPQTPSQNLTANEIFAQHYKQVTTAMANRAFVALETKPKLLTNDQIMDIERIGALHTPLIPQDLQERAHAWTLQNRELISQASILSHQLPNPFELDVLNIESLEVAPTELYLFNIQNKGALFSTKEAQLFQSIMESRLTHQSISQIELVPHERNDLVVEIRRITLLDGNLIFVKSMPNNTKTEDLDKEYIVYRAHDFVSKKYATSLRLEIDGHQYFISRQNPNIVDFTFNVDLNEPVEHLTMEGLKNKATEYFYDASGILFELAPSFVKGVVNYNAHDAIIIADLLLAITDRFLFRNIALIDDQSGTSIELTKNTVDVRNLNFDQEVFDGDYAFYKTAKQIIESDFTSWLQQYHFEPLGNKTSDELYLELFLRNPNLVNALQNLNEETLKNLGVIHPYTIEIILDNRDYILTRYNQLFEERIRKFIYNAVTLHMNSSENLNEVAEYEMIRYAHGSGSFIDAYPLAQTYFTNLPDDLAKIYNDSIHDLLEQGVERSILEMVLYTAHMLGNPEDDSQSVTDVKRQVIQRAMHVLGTLYPNIPASTWNNFVTNLSQEGVEI